MEGFCCGSWITFCLFCMILMQTASPTNKLVGCVGSFCFQWHQGVCACRFSSIEISTKHVHAIFKFSSTLFYLTLKKIYQLNTFSQIFLSLSSRWWILLFTSTKIYTPFIHMTCVCRSRKQNTKELTQPTKHGGLLSVYPQQNHLQSKTNKLSFPLSRRSRPLTLSGCQCFFSLEWYPLPPLEYLLSLVWLRFPPPMSELLCSTLFERLWLLPLSRQQDPPSLSGLLCSQLSGRRLSFCLLRLWSRIWRRCWLPAFA